MTPRGRLAVAVACVQTLLIVTAVIAGAKLFGSRILCEVELDEDRRVTRIKACDLSAESVASYVTADPERLQYFVAIISQDPVAASLLAEEIAVRDPKLTAQSLVGTSIDLLTFEDFLAQKSFYSAKSDRLVEDLSDKIWDIVGEQPDFTTQEIDQRLNELLARESLLRVLRVKSEQREGLFMTPGKPIRASLPAEGFRPSRCEINVWQRSEFRERLVLVSNGTGGRIVAYAHPGVGNGTEETFDLLHINSEQNLLLRLPQGHNGTSGQVKIRAISYGNARNVDPTCVQYLESRMGEELEKLASTHRP